MVIMSGFCRVFSASCFCRDIIECGTVGVAAGQSALCEDLFEAQVDADDHDDENRGGNDHPGQ